MLTEKYTKWIHLYIAGTASNEKKEANEINVKLTFESYENYDTYGLSMYERITKIEFDEIASYILDSQTKFWKTINKFD